MAGAWWNMSPRVRGWAAGGFTPAEDEVSDLHNQRGGWTGGSRKGQERENYPEAPSQDPKVFSHVF